MAYELATGELHAFCAAVRHPRDRRLRPGLRHHVQRAQRDRRRDGARAAQRFALAGHGVFPVPPHRPAPARDRGAGGGAGRGRGAAQRLPATAFMERYAPLARDLAPADVVARADRHGGTRRTAAERARRRSRLLDLTQLPREQWGSAIGDRRGPGPHPARDRRRERPRCRCTPTAHYAMGGIADDGRRAGARPRRPCGAGPVRRGRVGLRLGARRQPAGRERLAGGGGLRAAGRGRLPPRTPARHGRPELPRAVRPRRPGLLLEQLRDPAGPERSAPIRAALQRTMDRARVRHQERGVAGAGRRRHHARSRSATQHVAVTDQGRRYNTDLMEAVELGFLLDIADVMVASATRPAGVARGALPRRLPGPRRRRLPAPHAGLPRRPGGRTGSSSAAGRWTSVTSQPTERSY